MDGIVASLLAQLENLFGIVVILAVAGVVALLRYLADRAEADRAREKRRQLQKPSSRQRRTTPSGRPAVFYGRPGERRPTSPQPERSTTERRGMRPTPIRRAQRPAPERAAAGAGRPQRPVRREPEEEIEIVAIEEDEGSRRPLEAPRSRLASAVGSEPVGTLTGHSLGPSGLTTSLSIQARRAPTEAGTDFLGDLLDPANLGRAFVLSEIFGPPEALR